jgi:hypothetical protein
MDQENHKMILINLLKVIWSLILIISKKELESNPKGNLLHGVNKSHLVAILFIKFRFFIIIQFIPSLVRMLGLISNSFGKVINSQKLKFIRIMYIKVINNLLLKLSIIILHS